MFENKDSRTEISSLGEFGLIRHLTGFITMRNPSTVKGPGDDAAVIDRGNHYEVVTTDLLLEGVHFDLSYTPLKHLGYKAIMVNLSDVYAMNAMPSQVLVSIGLSNRFALESVEELYSGILLACETHGVDLAGGDTSTSQSGLVLSVTALGRVEKDKVVFRSTAREHDLICVSGDLGAAYVGLQILKREKQVFMDNPAIQPDLGGNDYVLERQLKPEARQDVIRLLSDSVVIPTSMIDISDGLSSELFHICTESSKGCRIYEDKIPMDAQVLTRSEEFGLHPLVCALNGGEDYELLFTIRQEDFEKVKPLDEITVIGHITSEDAGLVLVSKEGMETPLKAQGWDSIKSS